MTTQTIVYSTTLSQLTCGVCGIPFAMPKNHLSMLQREGEWFWCPNGHKIHYFETEVDRLQRALAAQEGQTAAERAAKESAKRSAEYQRERAARLERSRSALKGHITRMRNRIAAGVCPVPGCKRTGLTQTLRHIATKHPEWMHEHAQELA